MTSRNIKREVLLGRVADYILRAGVSGTSLRPLGIAAGSSDRMLLYYFRDKEELMEAALDLLAARLLAILTAAKPPKQMSYDDLLRMVIQQVQSPTLRPYMALWLELAAICGRSESVLKPVAQRICTTFTDWIEQALKVRVEEKRKQLAARLLITVEGVLVLSSIGSVDTIDAALGSAG